MTHHSTPHATTHGPNNRRRVLASIAAITTAGLVAAGCATVVTGTAMRGRQVIPPAESGTPTTVMSPAPNTASSDDTIPGGSGTTGLGTGSGAVNPSMGSPSTTGPGQAGEGSGPGASSYPPSTTTITTTTSPTTPMPPAPLRGATLTDRRTVATGALPDSVAFSPDGALLATADAKGKTVSLFRVTADGRLTGRATAAAGDNPQSVTFSPDGSRLAVTDVKGKQVSLFDVTADGRLTDRHTADTQKPPWSVAFSPDGTLLAVAEAGTEDGRHTGEVELLDIVINGGIEHRTSAFTDTASWSVAFSSDGSLVAAGETVYDDGTVTGGQVSLFQVTDGGVLADRLIAPTAGLPESVAFSPDGTLLATAEVPTGDMDSGEVSLFDVTPYGGLAGRRTAPTGGSSWTVAFAPDSTMLATAQANSSSDDHTGGVMLFDIAPDGNLGHRRAFGDSEGSWGVAFSPDGRFLAAAEASYDGGDVSDGLVSLFNITP